MKPLNLALIFCSAMTLTACNMDINLTEGTENEGTDKVSVGDQDQIDGGNDQDQTIDTEGKSVNVLWSRPFTRMNGDRMELDELAGYEIRYRKAGDDEFEVVQVDNSYTQYTISDLESGDYIFELAAYDVDGLYSDFVTATSGN